MLIEKSNFKVESLRNQQLLQIGNAVWVHGNTISHAYATRPFSFFDRAITLQQFCDACLQQQQQQGTLNNSVSATTDSLLNV
jgi:hypothetical protein